VPRERLEVQSQAAQAIKKQKKKSERKGGDAERCV
jgi:hypothetical protein